jgi:hypothetical protein
VAYRRTSKYCGGKCRVAAFRERADAAARTRAQTARNATAPQGGRYSLPRRMDGPSALRILGFTSWPSQQALQARWRKLINEHHPDHNGEARIAVALNLAYDYLKR